ncbi:MAG: energy-coupling factor transporter transmembrane protein EcfT [Ruminococcus sp.]|nr:energy-coupling factor transporter transmembrane protein EcfT [Ruminococcus sp.]
MKGMKEYNPISLTVYFLSVIFIVMFSMNTFIFLLSFLGALTSYIILKGAKEKGFMVLILLSFLTSSLINPIVSHNGVTVLFVVNDNPITLEAFLYGISAGVMITSVLIMFRIYTELMTSEKLLYLFGGLSPKLALILSMSLRYIPLFGRQIKKVIMAQKASGQYNTESFGDRIKSGARVFSVMVTWALENGVITADSMTARGYGAMKRSRYKSFRFDTADIVLIILSIALACVTVYCLEATQTLYYPKIVIEMNGLKAYTGLFSFGALVFLPVIAEVKEMIKWKYLKLKI